MASPATPTSPSSKRLKKALGDDDDWPLTEEASDSVSCSICLTEGGRAVRGRIDSCNHYFCFVCIMEWAKVESKCPICKFRFSTIRRPPKDGVFADERIVNIPPRDQVNDLHGIWSFDPYREAQCGVCRGTQDEAYLLICELCDSVFHTYCVGLGITIPQEDYFCPECAFMRDEHANEGENRSMQSRISLFDIARDRRACNFRGPTTRANRRACNFRGPTTRANRRACNLRGPTTRANIVRDSGASNIGRPE